MGHALYTTLSSLLNLIQPNNDAQHYPSLPCSVPQHLRCASPCLPVCGLEKKRVRATHIYTYAHTHAHMHTYTHVLTYIPSNTRAHTHAHARTHARTHNRMLTLLSFLVTWHGAIASKGQLVCSCQHRGCQMLA